MKMLNITLLAGMVLASPAFAGFQKGQRAYLDGAQLNALHKSGAKEWKDPASDRVFQVTWHQAPGDRLASEAYVNYGFVEDKTGSYLLHLENPDWDLEGDEAAAGSPVVTLLTLTEKPAAPAEGAVDGKGSSSASLNDEPTEKKSY